LLALEKLLMLPLELEPPLSLIGEDNVKDEEALIDAVASFFVEGVIGRYLGLVGVCMIGDLTS
jgi:hypothetical protein